MRIWQKKQRRLLGRNLRDLYMVTKKKLAGKFQQTEKPGNDKNGNRRPAKEMDRTRQEVAESPVP